MGNNKRHKLTVSDDDLYLMVAQDLRSGQNGRDKSAILWSVYQRLAERFEGTPVSMYPDELDLRQRTF